MESPDLEWRGNLPFSRRFRDVYASAAGGVAESEHVFLRGNDLEARFDALRAEPRSFVIGELGFGTGLNFLLARRLFLNAAPLGARLSYISCERYPLSKEDLSRCLHDVFHELSDISLLIERYPPLVPGFNRILFDGGRVALTLFFGDVLDFLSDLESGAGVDAWFLDGFAPERNPAMWSHDVCELVASASAAEATLSTYSAAGFMRRNLAAAGFTVVRRAGFGQKRAMSCARLPAHAVRNGRRPGGPRTVGIIGAGLAGSLCAEAFQRRGSEVTFAAPGSMPRASASAHTRPTIPALLTHPQFFAASTKGAGFTFQGLAYLRSLLSAHAELMTSVESEGSLRILPTILEEERIARALSACDLPPTAAAMVSREEASYLAGVPMPARSVYLPGAIAIQTDTFFDLLRRTHGTPASFADINQVLSADLVVVATGSGSSLLLAELYSGPALPMRPLAGQVALVPNSLVRARPRLALCYDGYAMPTKQGILLGSTYERLAPCPPPRSEVSKELWERLQARLPEAGILAGSLPDAVHDLVGWTGERCTTPDRQPMAGMLEGMLGSRLMGADAILTGFGSRGLMTAPLAAEALASHAFGEPLPLGRSMFRALAPHRFAGRTG